MKRKREEFEKLIEIEPMAKPVSVELTPEQIGKLSIEDALKYQKETNMNLESFILNIAAKMKYGLKDFHQLKQLIHV